MNKENTTQHNYPFNNPKLSIEERIENLLSVLTIEEKINLLHNTSPAIPRLGIKRYYHGNECLHGIVRPGRSTVFPQAIGMAATWDTDLIFRVTTAISDEARAKHHAIKEYPGRNNGLLTFWSPTVNMARDPRWGRTPETYGEDPHLTQRIGVNFVKGLQGDDPKYLKVVATAKHFVGNNQEQDRHKLKPNIPEKWLRDYYLKGFKALITEAKVESVMGAYNAVFDIPCNQSKFLLTKILREEYGFKGYVVTDCGAISDLLPPQHNVAETPAEAAASAINAGVDLECGAIIHKGALLTAHKEGLITEERINFAASNVIRGRMKVGLFDPDECNTYSNIPFDVVGCEKHSNLALETAEKSIVLLKNDPIKDGGEPILPINLEKYKSIAVVGPNAGIARFGDYSGVPMNPSVSPIVGLISKLKEKAVKINHIPWISYKGTRFPVFVPSRNLRQKENCDKHHGLIRKYYTKQNFEGQELIASDESIFMNYGSETPDPSISNAQTDTNTLPKSSADGNALKFSVKWEGFIKPDLTGRHLLVLHTYTSKLFKGKMKMSINGSRFKKIHYMKLEAGKTYPIEIHLPDGELGTRVYLSWKLPKIHKSKNKLNFEREIQAAKTSDLVLAYMGLSYDDEHEGHDRISFQISTQQKRLIQELYSVNKNVVVVLIAGSNLAINWMSDNIPAIMHAWYPGERGGDAIANVLFGDTNPAGRLPLTFYTGVDQLPSFQNYDLSKGQTYMFLKSPPIYPFGHGLSYSTFEYGDLSLNNDKVKDGDEVSVSFSIKNVSPIDGEEVVQLYVSYVEKDSETPLKQLKAFKRTMINSGVSQKIALTFPVSDLKMWNVSTKSFELKKGMVDLLIGSSSEKILQKTTIEII